MRKIFLIMALATMALGLMAQTVLSCYDIQYTTDPNGNSPYMDMQVTVQAIVTGTRYYTGSNPNNFGFFIGDATGGPWSGLFVYNQVHQPQVGDLVRITATVIEYYNWTELTSVTSFQVLSSGNPLPPATLITTGDLVYSPSTEQWENVFVKVRNVTVTSLPNVYQEFNVTDGSGACQIDNQFFTPGHAWEGIALGNTFTEIRGIVDYSFSMYAINPRSNADIFTDTTTTALSLPVLTANLGSIVNVPINAFGLQTGNLNYSFDLIYNPAVLDFASLSNTGSITSSGSLSFEPSNGTISINYNGLANIDEGILLYASFNTINTGVSSLNINNAIFNTEDISNISAGSVTVNSTYNSLGDTLTVIQHPILNIPEIVIPGETLVITCLAPPETSGWSASLVHGAKTVNLPIIGAEQLSNPHRWLLHTTIPEVAVYELYNLRVRANGGLDDTTRNAVHVVPTRKTNYYFAHITDLHMPTRIYWPEPGFDTDSLAVVDFRTVMDDLNLIQPEFVLITGDIINEGELEGFAGQHWYGWAQKVFSELQIPFYLTSGNHDIGGWNSTPPPAGSSRRNWWRYFGWNWLDNNDYSWGKHTQDYSFTYGNTHFIGLENYINYESWRTHIYGGQSYTLNQMNWLNSELASYPNHTKVLFHHYDYSGQLNLTNLGIDMALWGHVHSNQGSIYQQPYDLGTRSVCDGNRSYRMIRVNGNQLTPTNTIYAGSSGQNITQNFFPNNYGQADSVMVVISNNQPFSFENTLVKFKLPRGSADFTVWNGILEQVDNSGEYTICYVRVNLTSNSSRNVSIKANTVSNSDPVLVPSVLELRNLYPNPFRINSTLVFETKSSVPLSIKVYNLRGELVRVLFDGQSSGREQVLNWDGKADGGRELPTGMYLIRLQSGSQSQVRKTIKIK